MVVWPTNSREDGWQSKLYQHVKNTADAYIPLGYGIRYEIVSQTMFDGNNPEWVNTYHLDKGLHAAVSYGISRLYWQGTDYLADKMDDYSQGRDEEVGRYLEKTASFLRNPKTKVGISFGLIGGISAAKELLYDNQADMADVAANYAGWGVHMLKEAYSELTADSEDLDYTAGGKA